MRRLFTATSIAGLVVIGWLGGVVANAAQADATHPLIAIWRAIAYLHEQIKAIELTPGPQGPPGESRGLRDHLVSAVFALLIASDRTWGRSRCHRCLVFR